MFYLSSITIFFFSFFFWVITIVLFHYQQKHRLYGTPKKNVNSILIKHILYCHLHKKIMSFQVIKVRYQITSKFSKSFQQVLTWDIMHSHNQLLLFNHKIYKLIITDYLGHCMSKNRSTVTVKLGTQKITNHIWKIL